MAYFMTVLAKAHELHKLDGDAGLITQLMYLDSYSEYTNRERGERDYGRTRCTLYKDLAPLSFYFKMARRLDPEKRRCHYKDCKEGHQLAGVSEPTTCATCCKDLGVACDEYTPWFDGGLIFHGAIDGYGSGAAPTFSVTLSPTDGWNVHT
jgi:hypothetical protein